MRRYQSLILSIVIHGSEIWAPTKQDVQSLSALENNWYEPFYEINYLTVCDLYNIMK